MSENNGWKPRMESGSPKDMAMAYLFRSISTVALGVLVLMCWGLLKLAVEIRDDTRDMKKDWPGMKADVAALKLAQEEAKKEMKLAAEKAHTELIDAEMRVKNDFTRQLAEQIKTGPSETGPSPKRVRQ